jgi:branched-chain amino acid transport system permease protein
VTPFGPGGPRPSANDHPASGESSQAAQGRRIRWSRVRPTPSKLVVFVVCVALGLWFLTIPDNYLSTVNLALILGISAIGKNVLLGYAGQPSIGNAGFMSIGAYSAYATSGQLGFVPSVLVGGLTAGVAGLVVGLPALRIKGLYLIVTSLMFVYAVGDIFNSIQSNSGAEGGYTMPIPSVFGARVDSSRAWYVVLVVSTLIIGIVVKLVRESKPGLTWVAIHEHEDAAAIMGINTFAGKLSAFIFSSIIAGISGALYGYNIGQVSFDSFTIDLSILIVVMVLVGGNGVLGALAGAFVVTWIPVGLQELGLSFNTGTSVGQYISQQLPYLELAAYAIVLLLSVYVLKGGISGTLQLMSAKLRGRRSR